MSFWSIVKALYKKESCISVKTSTPLAISAAFGGLFGKNLFHQLTRLIPEPRYSSILQSVILLFATILTFVYVLNRSRIPSKRTKSIFVCLIIGFLLGTLGSFLGIGGGPFNVAILFFFFEMSPKVASQNSIYIIFFSQLFSLCNTIYTKSIPDFSLWLLVTMIFCAVIGSELGRKINRRLSERGTENVLIFSIILVIIICCYNIIHLI